MNIIRLTVIVGTMLASACSTTQGISKIESRALAEGVVKSRVLAQLGDILSIIPPAYPSDHPVVPLQGIKFWTTPHATETFRICSADVVVFQFTPATLDQPDAKTPARVSGIWAEARFRYLADGPGDMDRDPMPEEAL